jgi:hypothetical protein
VPNPNTNVSENQSRPQQADTQEIKQEDWITFFAQFTQLHRGAHARVEVLDSDLGDQIEVDNRHFDGIATDVKDGERSVWITFGSTPEDHLTRVVQQVTSIFVRKPTGDAGPVIEIVAQDQSRTLLELSPDGSYVLPPAPQA